MQSVFYAFFDLYKHSLWNVERWRRWQIRIVFILFTSLQLYAKTSWPWPDLRWKLNWDQVINRLSAFTASYLSPSWSEVSELRLFCSIPPLAHVTRGGLYETKPGQFPCKSLLHVWGQSNTTVIQGVVSDIMKTCDQKGYQSVAIPAISAGQCSCCLEMIPSTRDGTIIVAHVFILISNLNSQILYIT